MQTHAVATWGVAWTLLGGAVSATPETESLRQNGGNAQVGLHTVEALRQPSATPVSATRLHEVRPGDSPERIARKHGCPLPALLQENGLKPGSIIRPGQQLKLPPTSAASPAPSLSLNHPAGTSTAGPSHKVLEGETFAAIARQHGVPLAKLLAANPSLKANALRVGQSIQLPAPASPTKSVTSPAEAALPSPSSTLVLAAPPSVATPPAVIKILPIRIEQDMTYQQFASRQGTTTQRLNELNGLDLLADARLAKGSELLAPHTVQP